MDIQPTTTKPISDDQELAKVLAGITQAPITDISEDSIPDVSSIPKPADEDTIINPLPQETSAASLPDNTQTPAKDDNDLEVIKKQALLELRPLVDKLNLEPEEKFNIYLLLLRSTDDKTIIDPAYKTAGQIPDDTKRAQALLDVIKEIDYLSTPVTENS